MIAEHAFCIGTGTYSIEQATVGTAHSFWPAV
jgi:hypothetical protein